MPTEVKVPSLGESITEAVVLEWLVAPGERVELDQELVALETDKVTVNVSLDSATVSPWTSTCTSCDVTPGANAIVPDAAL